MGISERQTVSASVNFAPALYKLERDFWPCRTNCEAETQRRVFPLGSPCNYERQGLKTIGSGALEKERTILYSPMKESVANDEDFSFWYLILISETDWRRLRDVFQRWRNNFYSTRVLNCASQNKQNERWLFRMQVTRLQTQAYPKETRHQISKHRWNNTFQNSHIPLYCKTAQRFGKDKLLGYSKVEVHNHEMVQ